MKCGRMMDHTRVYKYSIKYFFLILHLAYQYGDDVEL
jgi:hypothetical protein